MTGDDRIGAGVIAAARALTRRVLDAVEPLRRSLDELLRVEFVDRTMVISAQSLLALVPLVVVLAAFLPDQLTAAGVERFESVTGVEEVSSDLLEEQVGSASLDAVRVQRGALGLLITILSASSFARAVQRMYEAVWEQHHIGGLVGRRRCVGWLLGWLLGLQSLALVGWVAEKVDITLLDPLWWLLRALIAALLWWWTIRVLLAGRVAWGRLVLAAALTGVASVAYAGGSTLVMPRYAATSTQQFGAFGLVLTVATWLVGFAGVMVLSAVVGRVLDEDRYVRALVERLRGLVASRRSG